MLHIRHFLMIKVIYSILQVVLPKNKVKRIKKQYNRAKKGILGRNKFKDIEDVLCNRMGIKKGDTVFVHSSIEKLNIDFEPSEVFKLLLDIVGEEGTLLFPCWHFKTRAEEYFSKPHKTFNVRRTRSKMGYLTEFARLQTFSVRSLHPTNSIVAVGKHAEIIIKEHHKDIYPCGNYSPFYRMMNYDAKIIGLGVDVDNMSFLHCVEDVENDTFPLETRMNKVYSEPVIDIDGKETFVDVLVPSDKISDRNPRQFFTRHVSENICNRFKIKGAEFFCADSVKLYDKLSELHKRGITIYNL